MNIKNLTIRKISEKIKPFVNDFFKGKAEVTNYDGELFTENYTLQYGEIAVDLPQKHLFKDTDQIQNASGYLYLAEISEEYQKYDFTVILLSNADHTKALFLIIQKINQETGETENLIVKNFIESEE